MKLMWETHQKLGNLPWKEVLKPAIELAQNGFHVSERLAGQVANDSEYLQRHPTTKAYFFPNGKAIQAGDLLKTLSMLKHCLKSLKLATKTSIAGK